MSSPKHTGRSSNNLDMDTFVYILSSRSTKINSAASLAVAWYLASEFGITGFQAGCTMWDFIQDWFYSSNKCGMRIMDYDEMLYPQHEYKFDKTISEETFAELQKEAARRIEDGAGYASPAVLQHWTAIADGKVPFGYTVK